MDALAFSTWRRLIGCSAAGMVSCGVVFFLSSMVHWEQWWISPCLEELLKAILVIILIFRKKSAIAFFAEALVYGMAIGAGFSLVENFLYAFYNEDITVMECGIRGFGTALLHMGCTAMAATLLIQGSRMSQNVSGGFKVLWILLSLTVAICLHEIYNMFLLPPFIQLLITIVVFVVAFLAIYQIEEKLINRWLDISISDDIKLLGAIKDGQLDTTRAGEYLVRVRERFHPEIFFDMLVYLQLYLELSIKAKSHLIMREAEMECHVPKEEHADDMGRIRELRTLQSNIGVAGLSILAPLIHMKDVDRWIINELL